MAQNKTQYDFRRIDIDNSIVSNIDNGIIVLDEQLHVIHYNKWIEIQTRLKSEEVLGKKLHDIFPTINAKTLLRKVKTALRMKSATFYTADTSKYLIPIINNHIRTANFKYMQQDVSIIPYDTNLVALIITDQTTMANMNALLKENIQKVQELNAQLIEEQETINRQHEQLLASSRNAAMGEMISMIAHQWRQPLSVINTIIATMKLKKELEILDDNALEESLNSVEKTVLYLSDTINGFRDYFKPNKQKTDVNLSELFNKSIFFLKNEMNNLEIIYKHNIDEKLTIFTYKNELLQVVINIIKNSIDAFLESNIKQKNIRVNASQDNSHIYINISDNAGGIKQESLQKIFEPYFSTKNKNGTGLGLYISHVIIHEHLHGKITASSQNKTTTINIVLPSSGKKIKENR